MKLYLWRRHWRRAYCSARFSSAAFGGRLSGAFRPRPALWFFGSMMLRMSVTLVGFYFVGRENWERWLLCLLGFFLARLVVKWLTRPPVENQTRGQGARLCALVPMR